MSARWRGPAGDLLRVAHELKPTDDETRVRVQQMLGIAPSGQTVAQAAAARTAAGSHLGRQAVDQREGDGGRRARSAAATFEEREREDRLPAIERSTLFAMPAIATLALAVWALGATLAAVVAAPVVGLALAVAARIWSRREVPSRLLALDAEPGAQPAWLAAAAPIGDPEHTGEHDGSSAAQIEERERAEDPGVDPLLDPRWARGIVALALAMDAGDGELDVERIVTASARGEVLERLPRRPRRSLGGGVQMLVDLSETMLPFRADLVEIVAQVRRVVGVDRVTVMRFAGDPAIAGPGRRRTWTAYEPPSWPRPVLVVTDLGLGPEHDGGASPDDWLRFARQVRRAGCPLVALTPVPSSSVPTALRRAMSVVEWHRRTSAASVAGAVRGR
jgi:hypothetical protein